MRISSPARPVTSVLPSSEQDDAPERFGFVARFVGQDAPTSSALTRELLVWEPTEIELIADIDAGHYFAG